MDISDERTRIHPFRGNARPLARPLCASVPAYAAIARLDGMEGVFQHFGGVTAEVLLDNPTALVTSHDPATRGCLQCPPTWLRPLLGYPAAGPCTVPGEDQGKRRAQGRLAGPFCLLSATNQRIH